MSVACNRKSVHCRFHACHHWRRDITVLSIAFPVYHRGHGLNVAANSITLQCHAVFKHRISPKRHIIIHRRLRLSDTLLLCKSMAQTTLLLSAAHMALRLNRPCEPLDSYAMLSVHIFVCDLPGPQAVEATAYLGNDVQLHGHSVARNCGQ